MTRLLIVDDEPDIREIIRRYAELEGYETTEALDGFEALALCRERDFDAAVMDSCREQLEFHTVSTDATYAFLTGGIEYSISEMHLITLLG